MFCSSGVAYIYWFHYDYGGQTTARVFLSCNFNKQPQRVASSIQVLSFFYSFVYFLSFSFSIWFHCFFFFFVSVFSLSLCLYDRTLWGVGVAEGS